MARILIVDDEVDFRKSVAEVLEAGGHEVRQSGATDDARRRLAEEPFDVLLTDLRLPGGGGLEILREAAARMPDGLLVVMTAFGSLESAIDALRIGAHDYVLKPVNLEMLRRKVELLLRHQAAVGENQVLRRAGAADSARGLVGPSPAMEEVRRLIGKVAPTDSTVLLTGETGTGKELAARAIHHGSSRRDGPFVAVNCGSLPDTLLESELFGHVRGAFTGADRDKRGLIEVASGGTLFLDEIGELSLALQPKLLRALETREVQRVGATAPKRVDVRFVAATNRDLRRLAEDGRFRDDLFFRIAVFEIHLPPLRDRPQDLEPIARQLIARLSETLHRPPATLDAEALRELETYRWPGNVRELANVLERALILSPASVISPEELPDTLRAGAARRETNLRLARQAFEVAHIRQVLAGCGGDKKAAAQALGIDISSLYRKLEGEADEAARRVNGPRE